MNPRGRRQNTKGHAKLVRLACGVAHLRCIRSDITYGVDYLLAVKFHCGSPLSCDNRIRLAVSEGFVDTTSLYTLDLPFIFATAQALSARDSPEAVPLERFCMELDSMRRRGSWLWVQVVHHFGFAVDNYVLAETGFRDRERECESGQAMRRHWNSTSTRRFRTWGNREQHEKGNEQER